MAPSEFFAVVHINGATAQRFSEPDQGCRFKSPQRAFPVFTLDNVFPGRGGGHVGLVRKRSDLLFVEAIEIFDPIFAWVMRFGVNVEPLHLVEQRSQLIVGFGENPSSSGCTRAELPGLLFFREGTNVSPERRVIQHGVIDPRHDLLESFRKRKRTFNFSQPGLVIGRTDNTGGQAAAEHDRRIRRLHEHHFEKTQQAQRSRWILQFLVFGGSDARELSCVTPNFLDRDAIEVQLVDSEAFEKFDPLDTLPQRIDRFSSWWLL